MHWNWSCWIWPVAKVAREFGRERKKCCCFSFWMQLQAECLFFFLSLCIFFYIFFLVVYLLIYWLFQQKTLQTNRVSFQHTGGTDLLASVWCLWKSSSFFILFLKIFLFVLKIFFFWGGGGIYIFFTLEYWAPLTESLFWIYILTVCLLQLAWVPEWTHQHRLMLVKKTSFHVHKTILIPFYRSFI